MQLSCLGTTNVIIMAAYYYVTGNKLHPNLGQDCNYMDTQNARNLTRGILIYVFDYATIV